MTKEEREKFLRTVTVLDHVPDGWRRIDGAMTAPVGYTWYSNGKSRWGGERKTALVKDKEGGELSG